MSTVHPKWLVTPVDYDDCHCQISREDALQRFSSCSGKMQQAYSYWMNRVIAEAEADRIQKDCAEEVQIIRTHLWKIVIQEDKAKANEKSPCSCSRISNSIVKASQKTLIKIAEKTPLLKDFHYHLFKKGKNL